MKDGEMPSLLVRDFNDPDEFASEIRHSDIDRTITQRGRFSAKFHRVDLGQLWLQHTEETLPRVAHVYARPGRIGLSLRTSPGPAIVRKGIEVTSTDIAIFVEPDQSFHHVLTGPASYAGMHLPVGEFAALTEVMLGREPDALSEYLRPSPSAMARLQRLHASVRSLAEDAPAVLAQPEAARGLEQVLIEAMINCLDNGETSEDKAARRQHAAIMRRFHRVVEEHLDKPLYIAELCRKVGASERTLLACCQEYLGMGPKRFLLLRRMHMVRRALRDRTPGGTTVTEIATRYGFWQFGRFAVEYKAVFGESPSTTLARPNGGGCRLPVPAPPQVSGKLTATPALSKTCRWPPRQP